MTEKPFYFKKFKIFHHFSSMKVGTDAVLLGAWADSHDDDSILEIGTGCGVIALMLAQKCTAYIQAVEIDIFSYHQAIENFNLSPWSSRLEAINIDFKDFISKCNKKYSLIVCNPPFFVESLKSKINRKNLARHSDILPFDTLTYGISKLLLPDGRASIILPCNEFEIFKKLAFLNGLNCYKATYVALHLKKKANRVLSYWSKDSCETEISHLFLKSRDGKYTEEYSILTKEFYI